MISQTVLIGEMMISCAIDAKEIRYVVVSNIPGTFQHTDMNDNIYMLLE